MPDVDIGPASSQPILPHVGPPKLGVTISKEQIHKVVYENIEQIRYCYEMELQRNQKLEGRVLVTWVIAATGRVARVRVKHSSLANPQVERCIERKIKMWRFPPPNGGGIATVNYPFVLKAS